ncbi:RES family NAD+ phosphorylase [uncultured Tateyamaria sp.]|uniref:RES family NAD+ phosphorylase n=1 Tax=uncultured Tateyamaria sp. TaxID=455651 RepID=UPI00263430E8|nr:RES family NAD+ phosphorylase [uncultured Tateyamaria sp.]
MDTPDLGNVVKALIRIHYNEEDYNHHWGGHYSPTTLLMTPNEIINAERIVAEPAETEPGLELLDHELSAVPYPDIDKGIGIYAGYSDGEQNMLLRAIRDWDAWSLIDLKRNLHKSNAHDLEDSFQEQLEGLIDPCEAVVTTGASYYRARIGYDRVEKGELLAVNPTPRYMPFTDGDLGAPPPPLASAGRLNRQGVSYLYAGSSRDTAISEIRPHPGHLVSLGRFDATRDLKVLDFSKPTFLDFPLTDLGLEQFELTSSIDRDLSRPITPERRAAYISAQFVADLIRQRGFDGVLYRSSVSEGTNLCVFDPSTMSFMPGSASLFRTRSVIYEHEELMPPDREGD